MNRFPDFHPVFEWRKPKINTGMVWPFLHAFAPCHFSLSGLHEGQQENMAPSKQMSNVEPEKTRLMIENRIEDTARYL